MNRTYLAYSLRDSFNILRLSAFKQLNGILEAGLCIMKVGLPLLGSTQLEIENTQIMIIGITFLSQNLVYWGLDELDGLLIEANVKGLVNLI